MGVRQFAYVAGGKIKEVGNRSKEEAQEAGAPVTQFLSHPFSLT